MLLHHQCGHNYIWNLDSYKEDKAGDGLIFSPVNIDFPKLNSFDNEIKKNSFFDPQFYLIDDNKGKLETYTFFPGNIKEDFNTSDLEENNDKIANECINFQVSNNFKYIIIPSRYHDSWPSKYYEEFQEYIISPFIKYYISSGTSQKLLLTIIVKQAQLMDDEIRNDLLSWITGVQEINGIYLIFDNKFTSKQIKDSGYLSNALQFIHILKENNFEVHLGYTGIEGFLYSAGNPDSISIGSYENLRNFGIDRFITKEGKQKRQPPRPRIYSGKLFQWIDYGYLEAIKKLYSNYNSLFEETKYKPLMFQPDFNWHFNKSELYKHYFTVFQNQINLLPQNQKERIEFLYIAFSKSIEIFKEVIDHGIALDSDSDGSHLNFWISTLNLFKKFLQG